MEEKTNHVSLRLFVYQPLMTCMWIWWTHSFDAAAPKLNLGSANVCFPVVWIFPPRFICNRTSAMSCMYGHIQPLQRAVYREFYYISLIKTVSIHLLDNPVCTFLVVYTNLQGFNEFVKKKISLNGWTTLSWFSFMKFIQVDFVLKLNVKYSSSALTWKSQKFTKNSNNSNNFNHM